MYLPPLQATQESRICINGDVSIHPSAAIAPGVLLQANPGSQIIVGAGACIGMGAVLHVHEGTLYIQDGASLGAGVLIVGKGEIGANACIGASSTLINCSVPAHLLVPSGSLLGDRSRHVQLEIGPEVRVSPALKAPQAVRSLAPEVEPILPSTESPQDNEAEPISTYVYPQTSTELSPNPVETAETVEPSAPPFVHGQAYVINLLSTLLPNRANSSAASPPNP